MTITIYSKPNCVFCDKAKTMVKKLGLTYEEKMFGKDFNSPDELYKAVGFIIVIFLFFAIKSTTIHFDIDSLGLSSSF